MKDPQRAEKHEIGLLLAHTITARGAGEQGGTLRLVAHPVKILPGGAIRNFGSCGLTGEPLADLVISAQCDTTNRVPYGWSAEYSDVFAVGLTRCEEMVKLLRRIDRRHRDLSATRGYVDTYAQYLARTAEIIGATRFGWPVGKRGMTYDDGMYHWTDAVGMGGRIADVVHEFHCPPPGTLAGPSDAGHGGG